MNTRIKILGLLVVTFFALLILVTSFTEKNHIVNKGEAMQQIVLNTDYTVDSAGLEKLPQYVVIDLREPEQTIVNPVAGAINIPVSEVLTKENKAIFERESPKVLISDDPMVSHEVWMLMSQMDYKNLYVMEVKRLEESGELPAVPTGEKADIGGH